MDKRQAPRVSLMAELTYQMEGVAITKRVSDISEGGLFIDTPVPSDVGTKLRLRFVLDGATVEAEGVVAYSQPFIGMGIEFTRVVGDGIERIHQFVTRTLTPAGVGF